MRRIRRNEFCQNEEDHPMGGGGFAAGGKPAYGGMKGIFFTPTHALTDILHRTEE